MRAVKMRAAEGGETIKEVFTRALAREVQAPRSPRSSRRLVVPLIGRDQEPRVELTNADMHAVLEAEDIERYGR